MANNTSNATRGWTVHITLANGQAVTNVWNGNLTGSTGTVTVTNASYNGTVNAGASTAFGFLANGNSAPAPTNLTCTAT